MLSQKEEKELLRAGEELFRTGFPNPDRLGCPGTETLRTLAFRSQSLPLSDRTRTIDHMTCCSPCFSEFSSFAAQARQRKRLAVIGLCAALFLTLSLAAWLAVTQWRSKPSETITHKPPSTVPERKPQEGKTPEPQQQEQTPQVVRQQPEPKIYRDVILDVRDQSVSRGEAPRPRQKPYPTIPRGLLNLSIYLPFGSEAGKYHIRIYKDPSKPLLTTTSVARIRNGITIVQIKVDTSQMLPGQFVLYSRPENWTSGYQYTFLLVQ